MHFKPEREVVMAFSLKVRVQILESIADVPQDILTEYLPNRRTWLRKFKKLYFYNRLMETV